MGLVDGRDLPRWLERLVCLSHAGFYSWSLVGVSRQFLWIRLSLDIDPWGSVQHSIGRDTISVELDILAAACLRPLLHGVDKQQQCEYHCHVGSRK